MPVSFGDCEFDPDSRRLLRAGQPVELPPKAFRLLEILIERHPKAVSKEELLELLWPKTFVSDASLHNLIAELRAAIGDRRRVPRFIRTLPRFGYAFQGLAEERTSGSDSACFLTWGSREMPLSLGENLLGRGPDCRVRIDSSTVSRHHARIMISVDEASLEDLGSKNGTSLNGCKVEGSSPLRDGDEIRLGSVQLTYRALAFLPSTRTHSGP